MASRTKETWRPVLGLEDRYEVSDLGRVRTKPRVLKAWTLPNGGHQAITIGGRRTYVHRLVAEAFLPEDTQRPWVNHKNGDPKDNRLGNLERCTPGENISHGYTHNGRINYNCVGVSAVNEDGEIAASFGSLTDAAKWCDRTKGAVRSALNRNGKCAGYFWYRT